MIKIFHTGDFHLDSAFHRFSYREKIVARQRQRELFRKMMRYVSENGFDLLLICGDLFDTKSVSPETEECVISALSELSCPVIISPGNHDPYGGISLYSDGRLSENVSVFSSRDMQVFDFEELGAQVCGYAFTSDSYESCPLIGFEPPRENRVNILCAHTELGVPTSRYAPIMAADIQRCGFTYAALGHIHKIDEPLRMGGCVAAYCGFPDSRGFDEEGEGGALAVTVEDGGEVHVERIKFGESRYVTDELDISSVSDDKGLIGMIEKYIDSRGLDKTAALKLTLVGEVDMNFSPDMNTVRRILSERLIYAEAEDGTYPRIDVSALESDYTLRGEVYRTLLPELESDDADRRKLAAEALKAALLAIEGRELI